MFVCDCLPLLFFINTSSTVINQYSFLLKAWWKSFYFWGEMCHGMTKSVKLVKVHRKDQSVNKNAYLSSFVCFFNFPDRNLIILYKIT